MSKKLQLQIPEPCRESWDKMTPVDKGRYCDSCQKAVVDFTGMSDAQLVAFFKKPSTGSVCGRFYNDQLERNLAIPGKRMQWLKYFFQVIIPAFLFTSKAKSQGESRLLGDTILVDTAKKALIKSNETCNVKTDTNKSKRITGKLVDEKGLGIPYASIVVKGTRTGVAADADGNFNINRLPDRSPATLVFSGVGFESKEMIIDTNKTISDCQVALVPMSYVTAGVIIVGAPKRKKKGPVKIFQRIFKDSSSKFFKAYPNPIIAGGLLNLELKKAEAGEYQVDITNQGGQIIHSVALRFETENQINSLKVPVTTSGVYFVRMTNKKSGKRHVEKIIIQ